MTRICSNRRREEVPGRAALIFCLALLSDPTGAVKGQNWPSFRGEKASGVADNMRLPTSWDGETGRGILWKTRIPGLAHSSPIVCGDRIYLTTAVSSQGDGDFKHGLYGEGTASEDESLHLWKMYALNLQTGEVEWKQTVHSGIPRDKRHIKATYANSTPASNGDVIVGFWGSEGVFALDKEGTRIWHRNRGRQDVGAYDDPTYEWGSASSPIIWQNRVIIQSDTQGEDFILALDGKTGETLWKTGRDELPSWGTPTVVSFQGRHELVTNASNFIRGYDPETGQELWRLGGSSQITAPTPIFGQGLIIVASGRRPEKPIFAIRPGSRGDITLEKGSSSNQFVAWHHQRRGSYMPTPLIYRGRLYVCENHGIFSAYEMETGKEIYRTRLPHRGGGFSASPVASDGIIYLSGEDGDILAVAAGDVFQVVSQSPMGERIMATPALSDGKMLVRTQHHLFAIGSDSD